MADEFRIDMHELEGRSFRCVADCALCCFCQPELSEVELEEFLKCASLSKGLTTEHITGYITEKPNAISLQGGCGACYFLKNRRCTIYDQRPQMCRQFPIHIHALDRIQLNLNLSCRGISSCDGNSLVEYASVILGRIPHESISDQLDVTRKNLLEFHERCRDYGIFQSPERLVEAANQILPIISEPDGIGRLITFTGENPKIGDMTISELVNSIRSKPLLAELDEFARDANYFQFELENPAWLPLYIDEKLNLNTFSSQDRRIEWLELAEEGTLKLQNKFELDEIHLLELSEEALAVFTEYAKVLIGRDHFRGYAYHVCNDYGMNDDLLTVYLGVLANTMLDLWWRSSLIGKIHGKTGISRDLAKEGIISFDMDILDAPTIGAFL